MDALFAPFPKRIENDFGIRIGMDGVAFGKEFTPDFEIVIDGSIKHDREPAALRCHRLLAAFWVYDGQPEMAQRHPIINIPAGIIGPAMG
jgi:hypothetical protein